MTTKTNRIIEILKKYTKDEIIGAYACILAANILHIKHNDLKK